MVYPIVSVKDVDASIAFYTEKLGFEKDMALPNAEGKTAFAFVKLGSEVMGFGLDNTPNVGQGVVFMMSIPEGASIDEVYKSVQDKGVAIAEEIKTEYWGDRTFAVKDPDGYHICLYQTIHQPDMEHVAAVFKGEVETE
jgi:uncharacterized glyoxalase superfamily protein PhnB